MPDAKRGAFLCLSLRQFTAVMLLSQPLMDEAAVGNALVSCWLAMRTPLIAVALIGTQMCFCSFLRLKRTCGVCTQGKTPCQPAPDTWRVVARSDQLRPLWASSLAWIPNQPELGAASHAEAHGQKLFCSIAQGCPTLWAQFPP